MKRLFVLILLVLLSLPLFSWYAPSFVLGCGVNALPLESGTYCSLKTGLELSIAGIRIKSFTLSLPLAVSFVAASNEIKGLLSPSFFKVSIGVEGLYEGKRLGGALALFYGYEDYTEEKAVMLYLEARLAILYKVSEYFSLMLPLSYTYTPEGREISGGFAVRVGGELL